MPVSPKLKTSTGNGSVFVEVPSTVSARLRLRTRNGSIVKRLDNAAVSDVEATRSSLKAVLNGGSGDIDVETSNGKITFQTVP